MLQTETSETGDTVTISGFRLNLDIKRYSPFMLKALREGKYEGEERIIVPNFITSTDRVLEIGTAVGLVAMVAARIVGDRQVTTVDANPYMVEDARRNFAVNMMEISARIGVMQNTSIWKRGMIDFHIDRDFWSSSLVKTPNTVETVMVPLLCLEDEIRDFRANTLICDIEGGEADLFPGSDLHCIDKIMAEMHARKVGQQPINDAVRAIQRQGFSIDYANSWGGIVCFYRGF